MDYDLASNLKALVAVTPVVYSTDQTSSALNTASYLYKSLTIALFLGAGGITFTSSNKVEVVVTHSDDDSTYVAVTDDDVILPYGAAAVATGGIVKSLVAAHASDEVFNVGYRGKKQYVKVKFDFSGTHSSGTVFGADWVLGHPMSPPYVLSAIPDMV